MLRNPEELEYEPKQAYVMINCKDDSQEYVIDELKSIKFIKETATTVGQFDIVKKIVVPSIEVLREIIGFKIRKIQKVCTTTIICEQSKSTLESIQGKICYV